LIEWTGEPKSSPAGNEPYVNFVPDNHHQKITVDKAKWYAFPDIVCDELAYGIKKSELKCTYKLTAKTLLGQDEFDLSTEMIVYLPEVAAITTNNITITGIPDTFMIANNSGKIVSYKFRGKGNLIRTVVALTTYNISESSQFINKTKVHENVHSNEYISGEAKDVYSDSKLYDKVRDLSASTYLELIDLFKKQKIVILTMKIAIKTGNW
jgi:hypothetical protein